jgi:hypothetical protein
MDDGFMKYSRNPNYVGEMLIYGSFATLVQRWEPWYVCFAMWFGLFAPRMVQKDYSLSKKKGWNEYAATSYMLPFKIYGSTFLSIVFYAAFLFVGLFCYKHGIEKAGKMVFYKDYKA